MKIYSGTTILALVARDGIVIGADSLSHGDDGQTISFTKLHAVGKHTVVGCEGLGLLENIYTAKTTYRVDEWVKEHLPAEADALTLANFIEKTHPFQHFILTDTG